MHELLGIRPMHNEIKNRFSTFLARYYVREYSVIAGYTVRQSQNSELKKKVA